MQENRGTMTKYQELRLHFPTAMQQKVVELDVKSSRLQFFFNVITQNLKQFKIF